MKQTEKSFKKWFNKDEFDYDNESYELAYNYPQHIKLWWDADKFNWLEEGSEYLVEFCNKDFDLWWNSEKFDWKNSGLSLLDWCGNHFEKWWDSSKMDTDDVDVVYNLMEHHANKFYL